MKEDPKEEHLIALLLPIIRTPKLNLVPYNYQKCHGNTEIKLKTTLYVAYSHSSSVQVYFDLWKENKFHPI